LPFLIAYFVAVDGLRQVTGLCQLGACQLPRRLCECVAALPAVAEPGLVLAVVGASTRPLSATEQQQLREIRQRRANRNARREIANDQYFQQYFKGMGKLIGGALFLFWPLFVWHGPLNASGQYTWNNAMWIALAI
jgi:hypothetical protein